MQLNLERNWMLQKNLSACYYPCTAPILCYNIAGCCGNNKQKLISGGQTAIGEDKLNSCFQANVCCNQE